MIIPNKQLWLQVIIFYYYMALNRNNYWIGLSIDGTLTGTNTESLSGPGCNVNEGILNTSHSFRIRVSISDAVYCHNQDAPPFFRKEVRKCHTLLQEIQSACSWLTPIRQKGNYVCKLFCFNLSSDSGYQPIKSGFEIHLFCLVTDGHKWEVNYFCF